MSNIDSPNSRARASDATTAKTRGAQDRIEGTLEQILFANDENGYAVAIVERSDDDGARARVTVVGSLAGLEVGSTIRAAGRFENHPRYGKQFKIEDFETLRPANLGALERYLSHEIKGVGPGSRARSSNISAKRWARSWTIRPINCARCGVSRAWWSRGSRRPGTTRPDFAS